MRAKLFCCLLPQSVAGETFTPQSSQPFCPRKTPGFKALRGVWGRFLESVPLSFPAYPSYLQKALFTKCILYDIIKDNRNMEYYT